MDIILWGNKQDGDVPAEGQVDVNDANVKSRIIFQEAGSTTRSVWYESTDTDKEKPYLMLVPTTISSEDKSEPYREASYLKDMINAEELDYTVDFLYSSKSTATVENLVALTGKHREAAFGRTLVATLVALYLEGAYDGILVADGDGAADVVGRVGIVDEQGSPQQELVVGSHLEVHGLLVQLLAAELAAAGGRAGETCGGKHLTANEAVGHLEEPVVLHLRNVEEAFAVYAGTLHLGGILGRFGLCTLLLFAFRRFGLFLLTVFLLSLGLLFLFGRHGWRGAEERRCKQHAQVLCFYHRSNICSTCKGNKFFANTCWRLPKKV